MLIMKLFLKKHCDGLFRYFGIFVSEYNKRLPAIYWLLKLPKNPTQTRFLIEALNCSVKPLSKYITFVLNKFSIK